ncbi:MAG: LacI family transcriptional regulator [Henriciella sp.]|nr:LacI family transcriptional regulator [Henriciella sp.]
MPDNKKEHSGTSGPRETSGSDRVTINDIARMAEVSKKTVSRVLNDHPLVKEETRKRVKAIMKEHGYLPDPQARALAFRRSFLIGLAYDNPSPQYVVNMQRGILDSL